MKCMMSRIAVVLLMACMSLAAHASGVHASLDRSRVQLGETVTLNLRSDSGPIAAPDLSPLQQDFTILGRSSGSTMSFVNGQRTVQYSFGVALSPRHVGQLKIPPLQVGSETTQPLSIEVTPATAQAPIPTNQPVFLEASVDPQKAYVGQQLSLRVKLFFTRNLANASLGDPRIDGVDVSRIGGDLDYQAQRNGRSYNVIERRYVLVPQHAGALTIPPVQFQGEVLDPNDPDSFLGMGAPVAAASPPVTVQVLAPPASWGKAAWLPARALTLTLDGLPDASAPLRVGQPFNLTMTLQATGLPYDALPTLSLPALDGATAYPDKPVTGNRADGPWVVGRRQHAFAIVPGRAGTLTLPAVTVRWWNVLTDHAETATIPAHTFTVLPASGAAPASPSAPAAAVPSASSVPAVAASVPTPVAGAPGSVAGAGWVWWVIAGLGLSGVLVAAGLWWRRRRRSGALPSERRQPSDRRLREAFLQAARSGDSRLQAETLLAWARSARPSVIHLQALSDALGADDQRDAIAALQRERFGRSPEVHAGEVLRAAFARGFVWRSAGVSGDDEGDDGLPPLYPFKLH